MNQPRDDFLPRSGFAGEEHCRLGWRDLGGPLQHVLPFVGLSDDPPVAGFEVELRGERFHALFETVGSRASLGDLPRRFGKLLV